MNVREIMTTNVTTADPDTTLEEIATMMKEENVGAIPVLDEDELIGIVTDRDIVIRCIAEGKDPTEVEVQDILSEGLETIEPDADVQEAADLMGRKQLRRLPVVANGRLMGMLAIGDIAVKNADDDVSGEALEEVSRGVKNEGAKGQKAQAKAAKRPAGTAGRNEGRAGALEQQSGRHQHDTGARGRANAQTRTSQRESSRGQGISNRNAKEERGRQERVVPIRQEGKSGSGRRKAG